MQLHEGELKLVKEANEVYQRKIDTIHATNILIPKEKKGVDDEVDSGFKHIQEEVRQLHF